MTKARLAAQVRTNFERSKHFSSRRSGGCDYHTRDLLEQRILVLVLLPGYRDPRA